MQDQNKIACFDFETYSEAGFVWNPSETIWEAPEGNDDKGLPLIGVIPYAEHESTKVLCLAYDLRDGHGVKQWRPGQDPPHDLLKHIHEGKIIEAWNACFEFWIWQKICHEQFHWPKIKLTQLYCAMAKARAYGLPGSLEKTALVLNADTKKDPRGKALLKLFSIPRNPTKKDPRLWIEPNNHLEKEQTEVFYQYNIQDVKAELICSQLIPELSQTERIWWLNDQKINSRGVAIDLQSVEACINIIKQTYIKYNTELNYLTNGKVTSAAQVAKLIQFINEQQPELRVNSLAAPILEKLLNTDSLNPTVKKVVEIRALLSSASIKKVYAMKAQAASDRRLHHLFIYHSARTGRSAGTGVQPQNLPKPKIKIKKCPRCAYYQGNFNACVSCSLDISNEEILEWNHEVASQAIEIIRHSKLKYVEDVWGDSFKLISSCLRSLFIAAPGHDLIGIDYKSIEAVVLAQLAGEDWKIEVFKTHGLIYEMSASKITGIPFQEFIDYKHKNGAHHPMRKLGKIAELASGYQGWIRAWDNFGASEYFTEEQIKESILAWRKQNSKIVEMWGGQFNKRGHAVYYGLEGAFVKAAMYKDTPWKYRDITYLMRDKVLYCILPSGRTIVYHNPQLTSRSDKPGLDITFETWNTNINAGAIGWIRTHTYGGKLTENVVQAVARDILVNAICQLESFGYNVVMHVHDEIVIEIPKNKGSMEDIIKIICTMPSWAKDWPIKASGWRGERYR